MPAREGGGARAAAPFRRILVVKLSALGDVAHALPALGYLRRAAPDAEIDWAVDARFAPILEGQPGLRRVVRLDLSRWKAGWTTAVARKEAAEAVRLLRAGDYDAAFDIQGNAKSGVVTRLSGARARFGFARDGVRESANLVFTNRKVRLEPGDRHIADRILRVVSAPFGGLFREADVRVGVATTAAEDGTAEKAVAAAFPAAFPVAIVHAGTTWVTKRMDLTFWAAAARLLRARFPAAGILLSWGSDQERRDAERIRELAGPGVELLPGLTIRELAGAARRCGHFIAPDTGPLHVAAAAGAGTVSVFRATDGLRNAPRGARHRFVQAPIPCTACLRKRCPRDAECRASIRPEQVVDAFAAIVARGPEREAGRWTG